MMAACALLISNVAVAQQSVELEIPIGARSSHAIIQIHPSLTTVVYLPDVPISAVASDKNAYMVDTVKGNRVIIEARTPNASPASIAVETKEVKIAILVSLTDDLDDATTQVLFRRATRTPAPPRSYALWGHFGLAIGSDEFAANSSDESPMAGISVRVAFPRTKNFSFEGIATVAYVATIELENARYKDKEGLLQRNQLVNRVTGGFSYSFLEENVVPSLRAGLGLQGRLLGPATIVLPFSKAVVEGPPRDLKWDLVVTIGSDLWWSIGGSNKIGLGVMLTASAVSQATRLTTFEAIIGFSH